MPNVQTVSLGNLAADGSTAGVQVTGSMRGRTASVNVRSVGNFGGGSLSYEGSIDNVNWYSLGNNAVLGAAGGAELRVIEGEWIRATMAGSAVPDVDTDVILPETVKIN